MHLIVLKVFEGILLSFHSTIISMNGKKYLMVFVLEESYKMVVIHFSLCIFLFKITIYKLACILRQKQLMEAKHFSASTVNLPNYMIQRSLFLYA